MRSCKVPGFTALFVAATALMLASPVSAVTSGPVVSIHVASKNPIVTSDVWTSFGHAGYTTATVHGTATGVAAGAVARLYASTYPFHAPAVPVATASLRVANDAAAYHFTVMPTLETRYRVEVFSKTAPKAPETTSPSQTVYVAGYAVASNNETCGPSQCTIHVNLTEIIQPSAIATEKGKHQYLYLSLPKAAGGVKPNPTTYHKVSATVSSPSVKGDHVGFKISITYTKPAGGYWWYWLSCTKDTLTKDGVGLPGQHGCGDSTLPPSAVYVG